MIDDRESIKIRWKEALNYKKYGTGYDEREHRDRGEVTENTLLRLAFHDCVLYKDGSGGCDGCLNYHKINPGLGIKDKCHHCEQVNEGNNAMLARTVGFLEVLYTTVDFPSTALSLNVSLKASGKSRADLWAFAGMVALELTIERANWACEHDFNIRQQQTLLEGREKCDIKLTKPVKFQYGRVDCMPTYQDRPYITEKEEDHPMSFGSAETVLRYMKKVFGMGAREFIALSAIHSSGPAGAKTLGTKYVWFGSTYLGNMYHKYIVNRPIYHNKDGGGIHFGMNKDRGYYSTSVGDVNGKPIAYQGWRVSCQEQWNTTEGGPCLFRPTGRTQPDAPGDQGVYDCTRKGWNKITEDGLPKLRDETPLDIENCKDMNVTFNKNWVQIGGQPLTHSSNYGNAWNNQFALPYEIGLYKQFDITGPSHRPTGCPGIKNLNYKQGEFSVQTKANRCGKNKYAPEGVPIYQIVEELADDQDVWAESFFDGWKIMQSNGYDNLQDGPQEAWLGYQLLAGILCWEVLQIL